ncbi:MAG: hypothetical protein KC435_07830 [Thermomicrobiales bacterium]|nr:hypothetical protein [Thermomicrobiales bacterium]
MPPPIDRLGTVGIIITTAVAAVVVNLIIYTIGSIAGGTYDFTNGGKDYHVDPWTLSGFTGIPLLIGLTVAALLSRKWSWVIIVALVIGPLAAVGTIFTMTVPSDLDTTSKIALGAAHVSLGLFAIGGVLALRSRIPNTVHRL